MIDDAKLDEWQKLCDEATRGPWVALPSGSGKWISCHAVDFKQFVVNHDNDAAFVATARTAMPELISELRIALKALERACKDQEGYYSTSMASCKPDYWLDKAQEALEL